MTMMGGGAAGGGGVSDLVAVANAIADPNFKTKIAELQAREKAANDAEVKAQAKIDAAASMGAALDARDAKITARETAAVDTDARQAAAKAYLDSREADLTKRESALTDAQAALKKSTDESKAQFVAMMADADLRNSNANAALDKRAAALKAGEDALGAHWAEADAVKADFAARLASIEKLARGGAA